MKPCALIHYLGGILALYCFVDKIQVATAFSLKSSVSSSTSTTGIASQQPNKITRRDSHRPWQRPYDPNFFIKSIETLENEATDEEIENAIESIVGQEANANILRPYRHRRWWLWTRWRGTIIQRSVGWALCNMALSFALCWSVRKFSVVDWGIGAAPTSNHYLIARLKVFQRLWKHMMTLTTFTLTFFLNQAYAFWKAVYANLRGIQGQMNDISLLLATHADRNDDGTYTAEARIFLDDVSSHLRTSHALFWASSTRRFRPLLTERGLTRMVARGVLKQQEKETLQALDLPTTQMHIACLEWIVIRYRSAVKSKAIETGTGFEQLFLDKICNLRGAYAGIGHKIAGRMPMAYAHFVQIMVDAFLVCAPFAQVCIHEFLIYILQMTMYENLTQPSSLRTP